MKDAELPFDRSCHVLYSGACKKQIQSKIALHYPETKREAVWERVQRQYAAFLTDWRTDLGGRKNFHNGAGGTYDCIAIMSYYAVCRDVVSFREIEEIEENLILPNFRKLSKFVDCNRPFFKKLMYRAFQNAEKRCAKWHDYEMRVAPYDKDKPILLRIHRLPGGGICQKARSDGHYARPVQRGLCVHGAAPCPFGAEGYLRGRLQMRLYHLRRQRSVSAGASRVPGRGGIPEKPLRKKGRNRR